MLIVRPPTRSSDLIINRHWATDLDFGQPGLPSSEAFEYIASSRTAIERILSTIYHSADQAFIQAAVDTLFNSMEENQATALNRLNPSTAGNATPMAVRPEVPIVSPSAHYTENLPLQTDAFRIIQLEQRSKSEMTLRFLFNVDQQGLFWCVYEYVEQIYSELDRLEASGIAIGLDLLPNYIPLADPLEFEIFSGNTFITRYMIETR